MSSFISNFGYIGLKFPSHVSVFIITGFVIYFKSWLDIIILYSASQRWSSVRDGTYITEAWVTSLRTYFYSVYYSLYFVFPVWAEGNHCTFMSIFVRRGEFIRAELCDIYSDINKCRMKCYNKRTDELLQNQSFTFVSKCFKKIVSELNISKFIEIFIRQLL